ncbi:hypothetical protein M885DRAFT_613781 [Pelagophyceae sp. CCMP2097]|nr:hypothetical protein M885DRAFT_613781 [Pelagophyceae sp. CCMP2097]
MLRRSGRASALYVPGTVIRIKRKVNEALNREMKGAEAQFAWQVGVATSLAIIFIAIPSACNLVWYIKGLNRQEPEASATVQLQQKVYDTRLGFRKDLAEAPAGAEPEAPAAPAAR